MTFPFDRWEGQTRELAATYRNATPFPHICLEGFLDEEIARRVAHEFPQPDDTKWIQYKHFNQNTLGKTDREVFPLPIGKIIDELNSPRFLDWMSEVAACNTFWQPTCNAAMADVAILRKLFRTILQRIARLKMKSPLPVPG